MPRHDAHWRGPVGDRHRPAADPAQAHGSTVAGLYQHLGAQRFDRHRTLRCLDQGAGGETGHLGDLDNRGVGVSGLILDGIVEIDRLGICITVHLDGAIRVQRDHLPGGKRHRAASNDRGAVDMRDGQRAAGRAVIVQHVYRGRIVMAQRHSIVLRHDGGLHRPAGDQQVGVIAAVSDIRDTDAQRILDTGRDRRHKGQRDREPVHFGVELVAGVVLIDVLGLAAVDVANRRGAVPDADLGLHAIDPDANHVVVHGIDEFGIFLRAENEVDGDGVALRHKEHFEDRGVRGVGIGQIVKVGVPVDPVGVGAGGPGLVGVGGAVAVGEIRGVPGGQDDTGIARRGKG